MKQYLTAEQVHTLNEKHGWFHFGDGQSDVSKAFAHDAIAMHEQMRAAAPVLYAALDTLIEYCEKLDHFYDDPIARKLLSATELTLESANYKPNGAA